MWFCIKCGKPVKKEELIRGYCLDCFRKNINIFKNIPELKITICPICGSWLYRGDWWPPASEPEILEALINHEVQNNIIEGAKLLETYVNDWKYIDSRTISASAELEVNIDEKPLAYTREFTAKINYQKCPRCTARAVGKHSYLVQIRFTSRNYPPNLSHEVLGMVLSGVQRDSIVNIKELPEGIDIELDDGTTARRIIEVLSKKYSAKINTSFRSTRFDPSRGKWIGVTTYVARIPVFRENDIVIYKNTVGVVKLVDKNKLMIMHLDTGLLEEVDVKMYWVNKLKHPTRVEKEEFIVKEIKNDNLIVESMSTGETRVLKARKLLKNLKQNDHVILIKVDDIETIVPKQEGD
ncbi:MAG: 60S ribosomal export protein NMD3 [Desulfurococcaceae archaeon]